MKTKLSLIILPTVWLAMTAMLPGTRPRPTIAANSQSTPQADFWVAPDGKESSPGTAAAPCATLSNGQKPERSKQRRTLASRLEKGFAELSMVVGDRHVELSNAVQRVSYDKTAAGVFQLTTDVRIGRAWEPLFDGRRPLIEGSRFDLQPTSYELLEDSPSRKAIRLKGVHQAPDYAWDTMVEVRAGSPLVKFVITCHLPTDLKIDSPQPTIALWLNQATVTLAIDQGPVSQTGEAFRVPFNFGFPAAYLWDRQREAVVFFNMSPMTWFSPWGIHRFLDIQIKSHSQGGRTGLGLHPRHKSGETIRAGAMVSEFYLFSGRRERCPTKFEALDRMIQVCAPLHPATSQFPQNTLDGGEISWETFAGRAIRDLMVKGVTCSELKKPWKDGPLELVPFRDEMIVHPDLLRHDPQTLPVRWNFPTVNHHLAPWMLYARLHPTAGALEYARIKKDAVPRFYDPSTKMIRSFLPPLPTDKPMEISWQSYVFYQEIFQIDETLAADDFNPAILGRLLMGLEGMIEYAHNVDYVFSTYFDPVTRQPLPYYENPGLGAVREPWTVGSHAFVMARAYDLTADSRYRKEASDSLNALLHTMRYTESNKYYNRTYTDPMDMPHSDLTGNAYGAVAAWKLFEQSGNARWQRTSRDFLNTLLRQTFWHEDRTDAVSRELRHAGLFYPYGGAPCATPWETSEANLCLAWLLGHDTENPLVPLLLKLSNLNRINSFYFYPAVYGPTTRALSQQQRRDVGQYFPVEPLYQLENMAGSISTGGTAPYMAGNSIWNWWLYEALAETSDRAVMTLNTASLEAYEEAISGAQRKLIVFNPTTRRREVSLQMKNLAPGHYELTGIDAAGHTGVPIGYTAAQLTAGIPLELGSLGYIRVELRMADEGVTLQRIRKIRGARNQLARAYQLLQERAGAKGVNDGLVGHLQNDFKTAMRDYDRRDYEMAARTAEAILGQLGCSAK